MPIYVSTSCLPNGDDIFEVLDAYAKTGLKKVELGSSHKYTNNLSPASFRRYDFSLICHHYFPPPKQPIIVNLASQNSAILLRSKEQIKKSIDFCVQLGISLLSLHSGFRADPDEMLHFQGKPVAPYDNAFATFLESVTEMNSYAEKRGVRIALENNVLAEYNLVDGENAYLLLCRTEEFERLLALVPSPNLGVLLDLGHLKVTAHSLDFDRYEFIRRVKDRVLALHVHENNGRIDEHQGLDGSSWCLDIIRQFANLPVVIESFRQPVERIRQQVRLLQRFSRDG